MLVVVRTGRVGPAASAGRRLSAQAEVAICAAVGLVVAIPVIVVAAPLIGVLVGFDAATVAYLVWLWTMIWPRDPEQTAAHATTTGPDRTVTDLILLTAAVASLVAVGFVVSSSDLGVLARVVLGLASIVLAWAMIHTVYTLRYANLYYAATPGGVDFNEPNPPAYADFAYLALTIGMTFQVSDTPLQSTQFRRTALRHALLSYLFGTGILATTINLVASLASK
jgi:uncharacterized membrane protein